MNCCGYYLIDSFFALVVLIGDSVSWLCGPWPKSSRFPPAGAAK